MNLPLEFHSLRAKTRQETVSFLLRAKLFVQIYPFMLRVLRTLYILLLVSCNVSDTEKSSFVESKYFKREHFENQTDLTGEVIDFNAGLSPSSFHVIDTLILVRNRTPNPYYVDIYGLKSKQPIVSLARRGKGPNEFLNCNIMYRSFSDNSFSIHDITRKAITKYDIDSLIRLRSRYIPSTKAIPSVVKDYMFLGNDSIVAYNHFYFNNEKIQNHARPVLMIDLDHPESNDHYINGSKYFTYNASGAFVINSPRSEFIWLIHYYEDKIELYSRKNLELKKRFVGPDKILPDYQVKNNNHVSKENGVYHRAYYYPFVGEKAIYVLYVGFNGIPDHAPHAKPVELFKLGFDGELLHRYQLDRFIIYMTIDKNEEYLYATDVIDATGSTEDHKLVRYNLNE